MFIGLNKNGVEINKVTYSFNCDPLLILDVCRMSERREQVILASSDCNHPMEFGLSDDFDVMTWIENKIIKVLYKPN